MPSTITYPDGTILTSTARTPDQVDILFQQLTCTALGIDYVNDPTAYAQVRIAWQMNGQPAWAIDQDVCILRASEEDDPFARAYDSNEQPELKLTSTRVWGIHWVFYGPDCHDRCRAVIDGLRLAWSHDLLALENLYILPQFRRPRYMPELFQGRWWKRTDLTIEFNELVTLTTSQPSIASAEILLYDNDGLVLDMTVE